MVFHHKKNLLFPDYRQTDLVTRRRGDFEIQKPVAPAIERWKILYHGFVHVKNTGD